MEPKTTSTTPPASATRAPGSERYALVSVSDKTGIVDLVRSLIRDQGYHIISTGGTYQKLAKELSDGEREHLISVADFTAFPEILGGRVKTLHPIIYGGILARRGQIAEGVPLVEGEVTDVGCDPSTTLELAEHSIPLIDVVVCNLYPFHRVLEVENMDMSKALELIDIGGVTLMRAAAKNWPGVTILSDPADYPEFLGLGSEMVAKSPSSFRKEMALRAFQHTTKYDAMISKYLEAHVEGEGRVAGEARVAEAHVAGGGMLTRTYSSRLNLKYGCNPHQKESRVYSIDGLDQLPIKVLNGALGYINLLDALNAWQLVREVCECLGAACAASFKHTSPAGVAVQGTIDVERMGPLYAIPKIISEGVDELSPIANAFLRARNCDPMSSFGDFIALNETCDEMTARLIKREISDGIIAPGYTPEALQILKGKKGGKYLVLQADASYNPGKVTEMREMFGMAFSQERNTAVLSPETCFDEKHVPTKIKVVPGQVQKDLILANITLKYSQSNNIVMACNGQIIGVAAGQQSRVDAVKLAGAKAVKWFLRQHPRAQALFDSFRCDIRVKRQDKVNALVRFVEGDLTACEVHEWKKIFLEMPLPLTEEEKKKWCSDLTDISMASDAFFPFRDNIDHASKYGVKYVMQPGGSLADTGVTEACNEYEMAMVMTGLRMFTH